MDEHGWVVGPETVRVLEMGHPWVIADQYTRRWPSGKAGDLIILTDQKGRAVGTALLDPGEKVVARVISRGKISLDRSWLARRVSDAHRLRLDHAHLQDTDAFRIVNGEGDGLPGLVIDKYAGYLVIQLYSSCWMPYLETLREILVEMFHPDGIYQKTRPHDTRRLATPGDSGFVTKLASGKGAPDHLTVRENGLLFQVTLGRGLDTGLFMDQRVNRREVMRRAVGKRVLNLFSYTGAFSVAAASAGATSVTSIDVSPRYTEWAIANFKANRIPLKPHEFIVGDCFKELGSLEAAGKEFDMVILDPPSFSTTAGNRFTTRKGTAMLVEAALRVLREGGLFVCSSNHQKYDVADYLKEVKNGSVSAKCSLQVIHFAGQPEDFPYPVTFPEGRYLKFAMAVKGKLPL